MACTTILVGKDASYDGSTLIARNHDAPGGQYRAHKFVVVHPKDQPKKYVSVLSKVEIDLPDNPMRYTAIPNAHLEDQGIWGGCGVNEANVGMTATETITSNELVLGADPLVVYKKAVGKPGDANYQPEQKGGVGEEDILTIVLPYIRTAREGVIRMGEILEKYGTYEMNGMAFQDENEIWWLETIGGHHWIAKRVPDDHYVTMPNQQGIDVFDLEDALGEKVNYMCSADMREFISENHLDHSMDGYFNARHAFGSNSDADHTYNTPRSWVIQRFFNPNENTWDDDYADFTPYSNDIPWSRRPEKKITVEEIKYMLSNHFQGTKYDPYNGKGDLSMRGVFRSIGINRNNHLGLVQIRPYMPEEIKAVQWITLGSNVFNAIVPFYTNIDTTPEYLANTTLRVSTDNFYWANRLIAALADAHFAANASHIERYQLYVQTKGREILHKSDKKFKAEMPKGSDVEKFLETANNEVADMLKENTDDVLNKVLFSSSELMKNAFARSDA